ncbi:Putative inactive phenolphthiocerol synthesis polyketide synthase type I Pks15 [Mycobacterium attenuatum]|uniref:beta-ketoacyl [acyl carrier protein] synthase domain-containing protein n=1 Tax=Mycobacterium attenuatum TaxID=2341086 RepID=UPI000F026E0C|nr:polyketide synthase [Mycobacterium attenuatum]VBA57432.1 Putative inactive phenolphthiocerol synthesis polyketide synthase type I Pks15 [Mycobacterium attenuatum]
MSDQHPSPVDPDPIVIVGMAIETPGGVDTAAGYWDFLSQRREGLCPLPTDRGWPVRDLLTGSCREGFKRIHNCGGFLTGAATFDPAFFGISLREAISMDPQQRVALRVAWRALEDCGINPDDLAGHDVGCYVGAYLSGYGPDMAEFSGHSGRLLTGTASGVISGRISYLLGLAGPALTIDSSCSSALAAFHVAVQALRGGDCDMALAGGVTVMGSPGFFVEFSKQHALSDDGHCRPYSARASGTVWAEGAAMFVLQRKSVALRNGRRVLAEVRASALNQDGRSAGLAAPSSAAQSRLFRRAMTQAGLRPEEIGMIEGHGTGTRLGDRTELQALAETYGNAEPGRGALLGSVKSNFGHAQAAGGGLGLAKVLVAAEHGAVPPTLHADQVSREIDWDSQGLRLAQELTPWPAVAGQRIGAVSAFGISGTNAHLIVSMTSTASTTSTTSTASTTEAA